MYACRFCDKTYKRPSPLDTHYRKEHMQHCRITTTTRYFEGGYECTRNWEFDRKYTHTEYVNIEYNVEFKTPTNKVE